jgi:hypothetical protein
MMELIKMGKQNKKVAKIIQSSPYITATEAVEILLEDGIHIVKDNAPRWKSGELKTGQDKLDALTNEFRRSMSEKGYKHKLVGKKKVKAWPIHAVIHNYYSQTLGLTLKETFQRTISVRNALKSTIKCMKKGITVFMPTEKAQRVLTTAKSVYFEEGKLSSHEILQKALDDKDIEIAKLKEALEIEKAKNQPAEPYLKLV